MEVRDGFIERPRFYRSCLVELADHHPKPGVGKRQGRSNAL